VHSACVSTSCAHIPIKITVFSRNLYLISTQNIKTVNYDHASNHYSHCEILRAVSYSTCGACSSRDLICTVRSLAFVKVVVIEQLRHENRRAVIINLEIVYLETDTKYWLYENAYEIQNQSSY
jgi:hypothetical protein